MAKPANFRIVVSESSGFAPAARKALSELGEVVWGDFDRGMLLESISEADLLWVRLRHVIDDEVMSRAPRLRWIASPTTGLNHIDLESAERRDIRVLSLRGQVEFLSNVRATAELTVGLMLSLLRRIPDAVNHTRAGEWNRDAFRGLELHGRTVGIVGYGRLGKIVGRYLAAFGARVLATDVARVDAEPGVELMSLRELLRQSDMVSLHVNLAPQNSGFFDGSCLRLMKPGSHLVNTSRGELIDETALLEALRSEHLAGAALDVARGEWRFDRNHPLAAYARTHSNLILTPHIGGATVESMSKAETFLASLVAEAVTGGETRGPVLCAAEKS